MTTKLGEPGLTAGPRAGLPSLADAVRYHALMQYAASLEAQLRVQPSEELAREAIATVAAAMALSEGRAV